eukprot:gene10321-21540_t
MTFPVETKEFNTVMYKVLPQSFLGLSALGLFYGWGALSDEINIRLNPDTHKLFANQHGTFLGVIVLVLLTAPMPAVQYIISKKYLTEYQIHSIGITLASIGLILGGISLQQRILWLLYAGCAIPCGIGELFLFSRIVFNHQLWFNKIGLKNLGSGLFGFFVGLWTVVFFVISVPLSDVLSVYNIFYLYGLAVFVLGLWPVISIDDQDFESKTQPTNTDDEHHTSHDNLQLQLQVSPKQFHNSINTNTSRSIKNDDDGEERISHMYLTAAPDVIEEEENKENPSITTNITTTTNSSYTQQQQQYIFSTKTAASNSASTPASTHLQIPDDDDDDDEEMQNTNTKYNTTAIAITDNTNVIQLSQPHQQILPTPTPSSSSSSPSKLLKLSPSKSMSTSISTLDSEGFPLSNSELIRCKEVWILTIFQTIMLTPGWGIKLASFSILINLFTVSKSYAAFISSVYVACYAVGRLISGALAQHLGSFRAYDIIMCGTFTSLMLLPISVRLLPHDSSDSSGCTLFSILICIIGFIYGGGQALYYSLVFDIYGLANYRSCFSLCSCGFSIAVIVGGLSSAYSFSGPEIGTAARDLAETWFYTMAGATLIGWVLVRLVKPFDYKSARKKRLLLELKNKNKENKMENNENNNSSSDNRSSKTMTMMTSLGMDGNGKRSAKVQWNVSGRFL